MSQNQPSLPESFNDSLSEGFTFGDSYISPIAGDEVIHQLDNDFNTQNHFSAESKKVKPENCPSTLFSKRSSTNDTSQEQHPDDRSNMIIEEKQSTNVSSFTVSDTQNVSSHEDSGIRSTSSFLQMSQKCAADTFLFDEYKPSIEKTNIFSETNSEQSDFNQSNSINNGEVSLDDLLFQANENSFVFNAFQQVISPQITTLNRQEPKDSEKNRYLFNHFLRFFILTLRLIIGLDLPKKESSMLLSARLVTQALVGQSLPLNHFQPDNAEFKEYLNTVWLTLFMDEKKNKSTKNISFKLAFQTKFSLKVIQAMQTLLLEAYRETLNSCVVKASLVMTFWIQESQIQTCNKNNFGKDVVNMQKETKEILSFLTMMKEIKKEPRMRCPTEQGMEYETLLEEVWEQRKAGKLVLKSRVPSSPTLSNSQVSQANKEKPKGRLAGAGHQEDNVKKKVCI